MESDTIVSLFAFKSLVCDNLALRTFKTAAKAGNK
jgi:hypothetical protein